MDVLTQAVRQAEELAPGPWSFDGEKVSTPALFPLLRHAGEAEADRCVKGAVQKIACGTTWFVGAARERGYLNLTLGEEWYQAVAAEPVEPGPLCSQETPPIPDFPADILPGDWRFLCRTLQSPPTAALAARQDGGNPAWLVRYTAWRLEALARRRKGAQEGFSPREWGSPREWDSPQEWDSPRERELLGQAARYPVQSREGKYRQLGDYLTGLARRVWRLRVMTGPAARHCGQVLAAGYEQLSGCTAFTDYSPNEENGRL